MDINKIMDMLDWNNDEEVQKEGRRLAANVKCLNIFMQPGDELYNKNVWENCALILSEKSDQLLRPYITELLKWLCDLNWPGSWIILERLKNYQDYEWLAYWINACVRVAKAINYDIWLMNMAELLDYEKVANCLSDEIRGILEKAKEYLED